MEFRILKIELNGDEIKMVEVVEEPTLLPISEQRGVRPGATWYDPPLFRPTFEKTKQNI